MELTWRKEKANLNIRKHGLDFSLAEQVFAGPLADTVFDGVVNGEERWCTVGVATVAGWFEVVVVVHTYPDPDDDAWVQVISLRVATAHERRRYEISHL